LLTQEKGSEVALNVAKRLVVFMQRAGGQSQFSPYLTPYVEESSPVAQVQQYVLANLTGDLSVSVLAQVANMSARNFARTFTRDTKIPPAEFVESARVDAARVLLENTTTPLKTIAYECGFNDAHRMRSVFQLRLIVLTSLRHDLTSKLHTSMSRHPMKLDDVGTCKMNESVQNLGRSISSGLHDSRHDCTVCAVRWPEHAR
jgi:transcriptional regulator GlxA family with amidase domain